MADWEINYAEQQKKEIASIKKRQLVLELSDADVNRLFEKAVGVGMFPEELLENFIGDLVGGTYSNGSDERDLADQWFERCGFAMFREENFMNFLMEECLWKDAIENVQEGERDRETIELYSKAIQDGFYRNPYSGEIVKWEDRADTKERWEERLRRDIRFYGKEMAKLKRNFERNFWKPYLEYMKETGVKVTDIMENQMKKLLELEKHREYLQEEIFEEEIEAENEEEAEFREEEKKQDAEENFIYRSRKVR